METVEERPLTLADVGLLARVQRPVVTTWRARFADRDQPFPLPVRQHNGQDLFDCAAVVAWLENTGRGNNPMARDDAIAFAAPVAEVATDDTTFAGMSALLCLRAVTGRLAADPEDLLDQAETFDSDDVLVARELEALGERLAPLARYADLLVASAFDPAEPFDELVRRRHATRQRSSLSPQLRRLVASAVLAIADEAGFAEPILVVRRVDDLDLVVETSAAAEGQRPIRAGVTLTSGHASVADERLARRWLRTHDIELVDLDDEGDGRYELPAGAVVVLHLQTNDDDRSASLAAVNDLCLNLGDHHRALVVGPAATLTDGLHLPRRPGRPAMGSTTVSPAQQVRSDALRTNVVRAVVRLPANLLRQHPRARASVWCLGPSRTAMPVTLCADLSQPLHAAGIDDLITDLTAAMLGPGSRIARELTHARFRPTATLSTAPGDLITPTTRDQAIGTDQALTPLYQLLDRLAEPVPGLTRLEVVTRPQSGELPRVTLGDAVRAGQVALLPGARVAAESLTRYAEVPVVRSAVDLERRSELPGLRGVDLAAYPQIELTRPGDVVVSISGGTAARVDHHGGVIVAYPARVLRCHRPRATTPEESATLLARGKHPPDLARQTFVPECVAADINAQPAGATRWNAWALTLLPTDQIEAVEVLTVQVADRRERLRRAQVDADAFVRALTTAVGSRVCALNDSSSGASVASLATTTTTTRKRTRR